VRKPFKGAESLYHFMNFHVASWCCINFIATIWWWERRINQGFSLLHYPIVFSTNKMGNSNIIKLSNFKLYSAFLCHHQPIFLYALVSFSLLKKKQPFV